MPLTPVQETLFFPLMGRADSARRWPELFADPWAEQAARIRSAAGSSAEQLGRGPAMVYGLRHLLTVTEVNRYVAEHPGAAVVNIGCGLDRLAPEVSDESSPVYNLDFPDVLEMRRQWVEPSEREVDLPYSLTDHAWLDRVDASRGVIAVAPGVMYYVEIADARDLVRAMGERFPGGRFCYDAESPLVTAGSERQISRSGTPNARMPFRLKDPYEVRGWSDRIANVRVEFGFSSYLADRSRMPRLLRLGFTGMRLIKGMYEVVIDFAE